MPGKIELGSSAATACAPECPMPQSNPVETSKKKQHLVEKFDVIIAGADVLMAH
jgi:hypothetical protein